jgi:hypothetical protein
MIIWSTASGMTKSNGWHLEARAYISVPSFSSLYSALSALVDMFSFKMCACSNDARVLKYLIWHKNDVGIELVKGNFWKFSFSALDW